KRTFWFFATGFIFILSANWMGLVPGVETVGGGHRTRAGVGVDQPLCRRASADLNLTLAMALVFFACWIVWALQEVGPGGFVRELFAPKGESTGILKLLMIVAFFAAGCLEIVSILFRPVSLSFRLYGNIYAGETMLETMSGIVPGLGWPLPIPFYFMELLVGLVQALVFMLLCAVFTLLMCQHEEEGSATAHEEKFFSRSYIFNRGGRGERKDKRYDWQHTRWFGSAWRGSGGRLDRHDGLGTRWSETRASQEDSRS